MKKIFSVLCGCIFFSSIHARNLTFLDNVIFEKEKSTNSTQDFNKNDLPSKSDREFMILLLGKQRDRTVQKVNRRKKFTSTKVSEDRVLVRKKESIGSMYTDNDSKLSINSLHINSGTVGIGYSEQDFDVGTVNIKKGGVLRANTFHIGR